MQDSVQAGLQTVSEVPQARARSCYNDIRISALRSLIHPSPNRAAHDLKKTNKNTVILALFVAGVMSLRYKARTQ